MIFRFNKIGKKLYFLMIAILIVIFGSTYFLNNFFLSKYYIYETKQNIDDIYNIAVSNDINTFIYDTPSLESKYNATIIIMPVGSSYASNLTDFNQQILLELNKSKINITKLWVNQEDLNLVESRKYVNKIFYQPKLQSDYFVKIFKKNQNIILIGTSMANNEQLIGMVNKFNLFIVILSIILSIFFVWIFTRKTVKSIEDLKSQAGNISELKFSSVVIKTGDEIEELSNSINDMSKKLEAAHKELNEKNEDLKVLLSSMSHEIKTPLALIKAYAMGMKDGLDDGTFADVILEKVDETTDLVTSLLMLSKAKRKELEVEEIDITLILKGILSSYKKLLDDKNIKIKGNIYNVESLFINAEKSGMEIVFNNLISNAIKYNDSDYIDISVTCHDKNIEISISNLNNSVKQDNIANLWKPFFVAEKSRSKELSGTGLGLSIVSSILDNHNFAYDVSLLENIITFKVLI